MAKESPKLDPSSVVGAFDQVDQEMKNLGPIVGTYWKALIDAGIPYELACELLHVWHSAFWERHFGGVDDG